MKKDFKMQAIGLLLHSILTAAKEVQYNGNVSIEDLETIIKPLEEAFMAFPE